MAAKSLTDCPSNLKEAIDWILRVTGKDGGGHSGTQHLAEAVSKLLDDVKDSSPELKKTLKKIKEVLNPGGNNGLIDNLATGLAKFIGYENGGGNIGNGGIAVGGQPLDPGANSGPGYKLTYHRSSATWKDQVEGGDGNSETKKKLCAKIFLGCLPLYYQPLTYIYWGCHEKGGGWGNQTLGGGALKSYFDSQGSCPYTLTEARGARILPRVRLRGSGVRDSGDILLPIAHTLNVADSSNRNSNNTLSSDQLKEYLRASCAFSSSVLGLIQGPGASDKSDEPWLFELFCNSAFQFRYTTGATLFSTVSSYAYALQFQLYFLFHQCSIDMNMCGWQECRYGKEMKPNGSDTQLSSHICQGLKCNTSNCNHYSNQSCKHNNYSQNNSCGKGSNPSALQAFLTDGIQGMCRQHSGSSYHLSTCAGPMCHVPMGFKAERLRQKTGNGARVYHVLKPICGDVSSPFRQLCEKLGCLTKRTPRSVGDLFGFTWHLKGQLSITLNNIDGATWFSELKDKLPFSYQLKNDSGQKLNEFVGAGHTEHDGSPMDLSSLHVLVQQNHRMCYGTNKTCGPYLSRSPSPTAPRSANRHHTPPPICPGWST
ncbi:uncharacterized protein BcabD6B2_33460 [Babesia caballi]|uniref:Variant erythrocyte surface antigen-1, beta subunit n=1 Tax=Babesia caballi TaxID=5871 RepID=A0AAV4LXP4_BABCB|nr:hypothetical protein, conserved [Babesia caballi]